MWFRITAAVAGLGLLAGCSSGPAPASMRFIVTSRTAPFFLYGPSQSRGADYILRKDAPVTLLKRDFGYSRIQTSDGQAGYVANEDIGPNPNPEPTPAPKRSGRSTSRPEYDPRSEPNFTQPDEIPLPGDPDSLAPTFRY